MRALVCGCLQPEEVDNRPKFFLVHYQISLFCVLECEDENFAHLTRFMDACFYRVHREPTDQAAYNALLVGQKIELKENRKRDAKALFILQT